MFSLFNFWSIFPRGSADPICPYVLTPMSVEMLIYIIVILLNTKTPQYGPVNRSTFTVNHTGGGSTTLALALVSDWISICSPSLKDFSLPTPRICLTAKDRIAADEQAWYYTVSQKKQDTKLLAITSLNIIRFFKKFSLPNSAVNLQQIRV